jgi:hypothetical protein
MSDLPAAEAIDWCPAMFESDRIGFNARGPFRSLRNHFDATTGR